MLSRLRGRRLSPQSRGQSLPGGFKVIIRDLPPPRRAAKIKPFDAFIRGGAHFNVGDPALRLLTWIVKSRRLGDAPCALRGSKPGVVSSLVRMREQLISTHVNALNFDFDFGSEQHM
jgi:hypothetical protein